MTKIKTVISLLVLMCLLSFAPSDSNIGLGTGLGDKLTTQGSEELNRAIKESNGSLVLINYWASYNANSHIKNIRFNKIVNDNKKKQFSNANGFAMISLSLDDFKSVCKETLRRDGIAEANQLFVEKGLESEIAKKHQVNENEFSNYLLDSKGVIIAKNLSPTELENLLLQN